MHRMATLPLATPAHEDPVSSQEFGTLVLSPAGTPDARIPAAAIRAGAGGVVDLSFVDTAVDEMAAAAGIPGGRRVADGPGGVVVGGRGSRRGEGAPSPLPASGP